LHFYSPCNTIAACQFVNKTNVLCYVMLRNFTHVISMQSNAAAIKLPDSGRIRRRISGHKRFRLNSRNSQTSWLQVFSLAHVS